MRSVPEKRFEIELEKRHRGRGVFTAGQYVVNGGRVERRDLVVELAGHGRRPRRGALEDLVEAFEDRGRFDDVRILVEGGDGRVDRVRDRAALLLLVRGEVLREGDGRLDVLAVAVHADAPAAHGGGVLARVAGGKRGDGEVVGDRFAGQAGGVGVRPVPHERGVAGVPHGAGVLFGVADDAGRADRADPAGGLFERLNGRLVVHLDLAAWAHDGAAAVGDLPFQRVRRQALVVVALPGEAPELVVSSRALAGLDRGRHLLELVPGGGRTVVAVLLEHVGAVVQHAGAP